MRAYGIAVAGISAMLLSGCGLTPEEQAAMDAAQRAADQQKCAGFGFAYGTESFAHCMMGLAGQREAQAAADRRAAAFRDQQRQQQDAHDRMVKEQADRDRSAQEDEQRRREFQENFDRLSRQADQLGRPSSSSDDSPGSLPSAAAIPGMVCTGTGDDAKCDAR